VSPDQLAAVGVFFSGIGSALSAAWFVRRQKRHAEEDCDKRVAEYDKALHEGVDLARGQD